jgi:hypothetical protein
MKMNVRYWWNEMEGEERSKMKKKPLLVPLWPP